MSYMTNKEFESKMKKIKARNKQIQMRNELIKERRKVSLFKFSDVTTSNKMLIASIVSIILFTIACLYIQYKTSIEVSSTLITLWYSFWTVEIMSLTGIKITKVIKDYQSKDNNIVDSDNDTVG